MTDLTRQQKQEAMDGSPARATDADGYINIKFQCGPLAEFGKNGTTIEAIIDLLASRLRGFQSGPFNCRENALAITKLEEAGMWLAERTRKRRAHGVEGINAAHSEAPLAGHTLQRVRTPFVDQ